MWHYTTHSGRLHHFPHGPGLEEQVPPDGPSRYVATSSEAFKDADMVLACRFKAGVSRVIAVWGRRMLTVYSQDAFLPSGTPIVVDTRAYPASST
jgi:hypothetical protein